jgi:anti-sigma B factor antagonist
MASQITGVALVALPADIDVANADGVYTQLCMAFTADIDIVVADMRLTTFCDSRGIRALVDARRHAAEKGVEIRFVIRPGHVGRGLERLGLTEHVLPSPTVAAALSDDVPVREGRTVAPWLARP